MAMRSPTLALLAALACRPCCAAWNFTVYSAPVELRYGEVHNKGQYDPKNPLRLPADVVERYHKGDRLMAVSGFDVDMVRLDANGKETPVLLSDHYVHHYILYFGEADGMRRMLEPALKDPHSHAGHELSGCKGMKGKGVRDFVHQMEEEGHAGYIGVSFGSASGAEYRHNPQRFEKPYRLLLRKPEIWSPTLHIINTNLADNASSAPSTGYVSQLLECPCSPQRDIDVSAGTIDGRRPSPPIGCSREFAATGNPSCSLATYKGGWRCCEDGMFLIDTRQCKLPKCADKPKDKVYMKFTFYYEDAEPGLRQIEGAACCDVTSDRQGDENIEYDVVPCPAGTPPERCVHVAESVQPVAYHSPWTAGEKVDLVFAAPHLHWAGISIELFDHATNKSLCEVHRTPDNSAGVMYGHGSTAGEEDGYLTGLTPCRWAGGAAPRFRRDHLLRTRAVYNATSAHTGVMGLWLMSVSAVPRASEEVLV